MLISTPTYKCELLCYLFITLYPIQRVIDRTIRDILGCCSNNSLKVSNELSSIPRMVIRGSKLGHRPSQNGRAAKTRSELLLTVSYKHSSTDWMIGARKLLKTLLHIENLDQVGVLHPGVQKTHLIMKYYFKVS